MPEDPLLNLQHTVDNHDRELTNYLNRIRELEEDIKIILGFCPGSILE